VIRKSISEPGELYNNFKMRKNANHHKLLKNHAASKNNNEEEESKSLGGGDISFNPNINNCSSIKSKYI
jgi:hypothetical protein